MCLVLGRFCLTKSLIFSAISLNRNKSSKGLKNVNPSSGCLAEIRFFLISSVGHPTGCQPDIHWQLPPDEFTI